MTHNNPITASFLIGASTVIIIAGLMAAQSIIVPILLAGFIAILLSTMLFALQNRGLHPTLALLSVFAFIILIISVISILVGSSMSDFSNDLPLYETKLNEELELLFMFFKDLSINVSIDSFKSIMDPSKMMHYTSSLFDAFTSVLTNGMMIIFLVIFMLLEASAMPEKLASIHVNMMSHTQEFITKVKEYMVFKTLLSFVTGFLVMIMLWIFDVNYVLLWGLLAFLLNYIPNIGSIIAALPAILLALIQHGSSTAFIVAIGFIVINVIIGSIVEPKYMGEGLGISTLVVFVSLIFWGWVLGPIGMLLSIPLTVMVKIALETSEKSRWLAILMSSTVPKKD